MLRLYRSVAIIITITVTIATITIAITTIDYYKLSSPFLLLILILLLLLSSLSLLLIITVIGMTLCYSNYILTVMVYPLTSELYPACPIDKNAPLPRHEDDASTSAYLEKTTQPLVTPSDPVMTVPSACPSLVCSVLF